MWKNEKVGIEWNIKEPTSVEQESQLQMEEGKVKKRMKQEKPKDRLRLKLLKQNVDWNI